MNTVTVITPEDEVEMSPNDVIKIAENEPDRWIEVPEDGVKLLINRTDHLGHLCGYVGIHKDHPLYGYAYGTDYSWNQQKCPITDNVHGGITFSGSFGFIDGDYWFFGWDYGHSGDFQPEYHKKHGSVGGSYKTIEQVKQEVYEVYETLSPLVDPDKATAFCAPSVPINPRPFVNELSKLVDNSDTDVVNTKEFKGLVLTLSMMAFGSVHTSTDVYAKLVEQFDL